MSLLEFTPMEFRPPGMMVAEPVLRGEARKRGLRELTHRTGLSPHTMEEILAGQSVRVTTLRRRQAVVYL